MSNTLTRRKALDQLGAEIERFYSMGKEDREDWAAVTAGQALGLLSSICGAELMELAYGQPLGHDRSASLHTLADRLGLCSLLFAEFEQPGTGHAISDAGLEAYLVARGDKPKLFAPILGKQGKRDDTFRIGLAELRALQWDAWLCAAGEKPATRHEQIATAFGVPWDTIRTWPKKLRSLVGENAYKYHVEVAKRLGSSGSPLGDLANDGGRYRLAMGFKA
jgi:hypothetical protein